MPTYVIVNRARQGYQGSAESMKDWNVWFGGLGAHLADRGHCGAETVLGGYTLVTAADLDTAVALTAGCPALTYGGGVEVGELLELNRGTRQITDTPA